MVAGCRVYDHTGGLVHHQHILILKDNVERDSFRDELGWLRRRDVYLYHLTSFEHLAGLAGGLPIDDYAFFFNKGLESGSRELGKAGYEEFIQAFWLRFLKAQHNRAITHPRSPPRAGPGPVRARRRILIVAAGGLSTRLPISIWRHRWKCWHRRH